MDAFSSFFESQSASGRHWSYDSLKNFRQISPVVQTHLKQVVMIILYISVDSDIVGLYGSLLVKIPLSDSTSNFLFVILSFAPSFCLSFCFVN